MIITILFKDNNVPKNFVVCIATPGRVDYSRSQKRSETRPQANSRGQYCRTVCVVQVPTQALEVVEPRLSMAMGSMMGRPAPCSSASYTELLYAHLLDSDNSRLTYTHYTSRVWFGQLIEINFNRPVYIQRNKVSPQLCNYF